MAQDFIDVSIVSVRVGRIVQPGRGRVTVLTTEKMGRERDHRRIGYRKMGTVWPREICNPNSSLQRTENVDFGSPE
jgi:hypothetical protein